MENKIDYTYPKEFHDVLIHDKNVVTRFPPENSGFAHLGHVKAMEINFSFAKETGGVCILRFDDTNPSAEKQEFYDSIREDVIWMGYSFISETNTSDYFDVLYNLAVTLISNDNAYVCELSRDDMKRYREENIESPFKSRPIEESLKLFEEMKNGKHPEGSLTLRMKGDINNPNTTLWDIVMYRIIKKDHPKTGNTWQIYPSYDYSHGIVDSLENITHSFCTTEYIVRRDQYYWFLDKLGMRKPYVYEFGRLEVENELLSKRKIKELVANNLVFGWDDPRLLTIKGLRRRGYTPDSLKEFCRHTGITRTEVVLSKMLLESIIREKLNTIAHRKMVVMNPLKLVITNFTEDINCSALDYPFDKNSTTRNVVLTKELYIDSNNFKVVDSKKFYGLAPGKTIRLKYGPFVEFESYDDKELTVYVKFSEPPNPKKIKGILNWVGSDYNEITVRLFDGLNMEEKECYAEKSLSMDNLQVGDKFQFEKYGFYCLDEDSIKKNKPIFNETVKLKSSY